MSLIYSFLFCGLVCLLSEVIINNTKLSPGHVTSLFSIIGAILSFLGIYSIIIKKAKMGAIILISNFGNSLYLAAIEGYKNNKILGILSNMLNKSSLVLSSTIIFSFIFVCLFKPRD